MDLEKRSRATAPMVQKKFDELWTSLFSTQVHLDSALSKQSQHLKSILAQIVPLILLRPVSQAEVMGIGVAPGEPWSLNPAEIARWRPARMLAMRLYEMLSQRQVAPEPQLSDFPESMTQAWEKDWGHSVAIQLARVLGTSAPLSLRAVRKEGPAALLEELSAGSKLPVKAEVSQVSPLGVRLSGYTPVLGTEAYARGAFEIQDEGSQLMSLFALWPAEYASELQDRPGPKNSKSSSLMRKLPEPLPWTVVDACAGAGGKSLALSDAMAGKGRIFAYDTSKTKLLALRRRAKRAGLNNIQTVALQDGKESETLSKYKKRAHVVLVDAPCSGWGVLRRNPDIKWRQSAAVLEKMPTIQLRLLKEYSQLLAGEGRLVYGVCTFRRAETVDVVEAFLREHPEFQKGPGGFLGPDSSDGFFMQALTRRGKS